MQQTSGSSFWLCGDDDEVVFFVVVFLSLSPSFLGCRGGGDEVVVVVVRFLLMVHDRYSLSLRLIVSIGWLCLVERTDRPIETGGCLVC